MSKRGRREVTRCQDGLQSDWERGKRKRVLRQRLGEILGKIPKTVRVGSGERDYFSDEAVHASTKGEKVREFHNEREIPMVRAPKRATRSSTTWWGSLSSSELESVGEKK